MGLNVNITLREKDADKIAKIIQTIRAITQKEPIVKINNAPLKTMIRQ